MPHINELIVLSRPVQGTDTLIIETQDGTRRLAATAFKGEQGERGLKGDKGDQGIQGLQGLQGWPGVNGAKGDQGIKGDKGDQGIQGIQGLQGIQGTQGPPGTAAGIRETAALSTGVLASNAIETGLFSLATSFEMLRVVLSSAARVRLYNTAAKRDADVSRSVYVKPGQGNGLIVDINAYDVLNQSLDPHAHGSNMDASPSDAIYYAVTNNGTTAAITVTFTFLRKEQ